MIIYQNNECILKVSGRFSNKSSKWKTELKSGKLPHKTVDNVYADICMVISAEFYVIFNTIYPRIRPQHGSKQELHHIII